MLLMSPKSKQINKPKSTFRWCDREDKYFPVSKCKKLGEMKPSCQRCLKAWQFMQLQLPLPFKELKVKEGP
jgi:hypothetical protein